MSVQIFLRGKLLGIGDLLIAPPISGDDAFLGRSGWVALLTEVLPRALLAELGLARILLGSSGGDQFLVVLPSECRERAKELMAAAGVEISALSGGRIRLIWAITENLGDWSDIRKRLNEQLALQEGTPLPDPAWFRELTEPVPDDDYFVELAGKLREASTVGWSAETSGRVLAGEGKYSWPIDGSAESILFARHHAPPRDGRPVWGVLRGDVDNFLIRLRRLQTIEEYLQLSLTYKQFFAGELTIRCSMPEFWQKVSILYAGGDDFAVYGDWDALLPLARELQRVFHRFAEENLKDLPGPEGKTITMAVALAQSPDATLDSVYEEAGDSLDLAKSSDKDCIFALGRILEWKQLSDAAELKDDLTALAAKYGASPQYLNELCGLYRETAATRSGSRRSRSSERPWRYHRRLMRILPAVRDREGQKAVANVIAGFVGRNPANAKLRPSGRVALEWARLAAADRPASDRRTRRERANALRAQRPPRPPRNEPKRREQPRREERPVVAAAVPPEAVPAPETALAPIGTTALAIVETSPSAPVTERTHEVDQSSAEPNRAGVEEAAAPAEPAIPTPEPQTDIVSSTDFAAPEPVPDVAPEPPANQETTEQKPE